MLPQFVFLFLAWTVCLVGSVVWIVKKVTHRSCTSRKTMVGKTVIITGGNAGIGKETAIELASRGARVILACRSRSRGQEAKDEIKRLTGGDVILKSLDLCSLVSVRAFAEDVLATESRLDVLINNAGIGQAKIVTTVDGFEETFQANYLGHFLLTNLLLELLKKSSPSRIIFVSSTMHYLGSNRRLLNGYSDVKSGHVFGTYLYGDTKLAAIQFAKELSQRLKGTGVTANALHPGYVQTNILFNGSNIVNMILMCGSYIWAKTPSQGAQTTLHLALSDEVANVSGKYFSECRQAWTSFEAFDREARKKIWEMSCRMTGLPANLHEDTSSAKH